MKLISTTDFVLRIDEIVKQPEDQDSDDFNLDFLSIIEKYAKFLKQPLTLGMFFPCDEIGNILTEPFYDPANEQYWAGERFMYDLAKEKVLFKDCEVKNIKATRKHDIDYFVVYYKSQQLWISWTERIIEDMIKHSLELSESAMKEIGI